MTQKGVCNLIIITQNFAGSSHTIQKYFCQRNSTLFKDSKMRGSVTEVNKRAPVRLQGYFSVDSIQRNRIDMKNNLMKLINRRVNWQISHKHFGRTHSSKKGLPPTLSSFWY